MKVYSTGDTLSTFTSCLLYGMAGAGKTPMAATCPSPLILSSEPGLLSLKRHNLPYVQARDKTEAMAAIEWAEKQTQFQTLFFDSISALSENILTVQKRKTQDPRKFSPLTTADTMEVVMRFLAIQSKHLVMTCKATRTQVSELPPVTMIEPFAVVPKLGPLLPYHFDVVAYMSRYRDTAGADQAMFTCGANDGCIARDRSGVLALYEPAHLGMLFNKLNNGA